MNLMGKLVNDSTDGDTSQPFEFSVFKKPDWHFHAENFTLHLEAIGGNILHGITTGMFNEYHVEPALQLKETVIRSMGLERKPYYLVIGLTETKGASQKARNRYIEGILRLFKKHPFQVIVFYGANRLLTAGINLAKPFVPFSVRVVKDFEKALEFISEEKTQDIFPVELPSNEKTIEKTTEPNQVQDFVEEILSYIEQINWEVDGINQLEDKDSTHPLYKVFEALKLINCELYYL